MKNVALIGLEYTGKSFLFNLLTRSSVSDERNFRGSSIICREKALEQGLGKLIDTPGIRYQSDNVTTELVLAALQRSRQQLAIVLTFADKVTAGLEQITRQLREILQVPVMALDVRRAGEKDLQQLFSLIEHAGQPMLPCFLERLQPRFRLQCG